MARDNEQLAVEATVARLEREVAANGPLRALVIEGQPTTRLGLRIALADAGIRVAAVCATLAEALTILRGGRADVALVDLALSDAAGVEAVARIAAEAPGLPLVAFSNAGGQVPAQLALRAGARGFLRKDAAPEAIIAALRAAASGLVVLAPEDFGAAPGPAPVSPEPAERPVRTGEPLTARELELLRHLAEGATNKEIARVMVLAEDTVKKAVQTLIGKLGATDRTHAVVLALRASLIS